MFGPPINMISPERMPPVVPSGKMPSNSLDIFLIVSSMPIPSTDCLKILEGSTTVSKFFKFKIVCSLSRVRFKVLRMVKDCRLGHISGMLCQSNNGLLDAMPMWEHERDKPVSNGLGHSKRLDQSPKQETDVFKFTRLGRKLALASITQWVGRNFNEDMFNSRLYSWVQGISLTMGSMLVQ